LAFRVIYRKGGWQSQQIIRTKSDSSDFVSNCCAIYLHHLVAGLQVSSKWDRRCPGVDATDSYLSVIRLPDLYSFRVARWEIVSVPDGDLWDSGDWRLILPIRDHSDMVIGIRSCVFSVAGLDDFSQG